MEKFAQEAADRTGGKYSASEIIAFVTAQSKFASKPLYSLVCEMLRAGDTNPRARASCIADLEAIAGEEGSHAITVQLSKEVRDEAKRNGLSMHSLNVWLSIGPKDLRPELEVPDDDFAKTVFANYERLKAVAVCVWKQFQIDKPSLYTTICELVGRDMSTIINPAENLTSLCFDEAFPQRIVILAAYSDKNGLFYKKKGK